MATATVEPSLAKDTKLEMTVSRSALLAELALAQSITSAATTIPILSNLLLEANDGLLSITGTDLDRSIRTSIHAQVKQPGAVTVPARKLYDYVRLLPEGNISIKAQDNAWVHISCGRSRTKMVGMARANYPQVVSADGQVQVKFPVPSMRLLISHTAFAVSTEQSRYTLQGALFCFAPGKMLMVATDGHRLAYVEKDEQIAGVAEATSMIIPMRALHDLQSLLAETGETEIGFSQDDANLSFTFGARQYTTRKLVGNFPNYAKAIPTGNDKVILVGTADIEKSIRRVAQFSDDRTSTVKLSLENNALKISANSPENGESEEMIETPYTKDAVKIGLNSSYLLDFFKTIGGRGEVRFEMKDGNSAILLKPEVTNPDHVFFCVLMPCRL